MVRVAVVGALVVFVITYLVIASRQLRWLGLDRPAGATVGAVAMVLVGGLSMDAALRAIDLHVVALLFGILLITAVDLAVGFGLLAVERALGVPGWLGLS